MGDFAIADRSCISCDDLGEDFICGNGTAKCIDGLVLADYSSIICIKLCDGTTEEDDCDC